MSKRTALSPGLAILIVALVQITEAQQTKKVPKIAILRPVASPDSLTEAFRQ